MELTKPTEVENYVIELLGVLTYHSQGCRLPNCGECQKLYNVQQLLMSPYARPRARVQMQS